MNAVNDFVQQRSFVDVKLVCKNKKTVYSHKLILASASPFLKSVIEEMNSYDDMATVFLPDFDYNIVTLLLTFLCEGIMKLTWEELAEFRELCNGLGMNFPGADVVKVLKESHYSQSSGTQQEAATPADPNTDAERRFPEKSSSVTSGDAVHTPVEVRDTANTHNIVASIVPKIEDCEECQNFEVTESVPSHGFQNKSQMPHVNTTQQSLDGNDFSQPEKHRQRSLEAGGSCRHVRYSHDATPTDLNLWHTPSSSVQELSQNNERSRMASIPLVSRPMQQITSHSSYSHVAHQKSKTEQMLQHVKATTKNSHNECDKNSIVLMSGSANQSACQLIKKQSKAKVKKLHNGAGVQKKQLTQLSNSSSVNKKLQEQIVSISHKIKQSHHLNSKSKQSDSKVGSKTQMAEKSVYPRKKKKSEGT